MFGCIGRVGCVVMLAVIAAAGWYTKPYWYPRVHAMVVATPPAKNITWKPIGPEAATRGSQAAARLNDASGPVYADLTPAEFAAWLLEPAMKILGTSGANPEASVHGDTLFVRGNVAVSELGDPKALGPLASMMRGRQPVLIGGRLEMLKPGALGLHVTQMSVNDLRLPSALIAKIMARVAVRERADVVAPGVVSIAVPKSIVDARISNGKIVLYKAVP